MKNASPPTFPETFSVADYFLFDRIKEGKGDKVALRYGDLEYTYQEVADKSRAFAQTLMALGIEREERVYCVLPDCPPFVWSIFGTIARGSILAMGNPLSPENSLLSVLEYSRASCLVTTDTAFARLAPHLGQADHLRAVLLCPDTKTGENPEAPVAGVEAQSDLVVQSLATQPSPDAAINLPELKRDDPCVWLFTSGSTGTPKAAVHTHRDFAFNTEVYAKGTVGYRHDDVALSVPRLFFGYATGTNLWFPFSVGATVGLFSERPTAESLVGAIEKYQPTIVTNVPTMMGKLLDYDDELTSSGRSGIDMSSVRFHLSAGEALPPPLLERFHERFGAEVYDGIGSAEMFHIYVSNRPNDVKPGSLGRLVDGYQARVLPVDAEGPGAEEVPLGEVGVLWVKGDSVAICYHQDRDKSWDTFHGHWCRTSDLFSRDENGYFWFAGRADDLFKVGGVFVSPTEVENCLLRHPDVHSAAVVPHADDGLEKPFAFVVLRDPCESEDKKIAELQEHVKSCLSKYLSLIHI